MLKYNASRRLSDEVSAIIWTICVDCVLTVTPCRRTSSGSLGSAIDTRFWTSTVAMSMSVPMSKVTVNAYEPSAALLEDIDSMFSTPLTSCSIGAATVSATI